MKITKTMVTEFIGVLAAIFAVNSQLINPYVAASIVGVATVIAYNLFPSDDTGGGPVINVISMVSIIAGIAGYFLDHPRDVVEVVNGQEVHKLIYLLPIATLSSIKGTLVILIRWWETRTKGS